MATADIVNDLISGEVDGIRRSGWYVITNSQNPGVINPLVPFLTEIELKIKNLNLGGGFAPNKRFAEYAVRVIKHYAINKECSCALFPEIGLDLNPNKAYNNVHIVEIQRIEDQWIDYYIVECKKCSQRYKVFEQDGHWLFFEWKKI